MRDLNKIIQEASFNSQTDLHLDLAQQVNGYFFDAKELTKE